MCSLTMATRLSSSVRGAVISRPPVQKANAFGSFATVGSSSGQCRTSTVRIVLSVDPPHALGGVDLVVK